MIKLVKTGLDSLIEHSRPKPRTPADRGTNVPRSSRAQHPRHPAELTYRPGKQRPAVEPFQPRHHNPRTTAQRELGSIVWRLRGTYHVPRPIQPSDQEGFAPRPVFWSILEHMGHKEHGGTWHMEAAQLDTQRKKGEAILKTSSTVHSTNRSSSSTRPAKLQLDRAGVKVKPEKCCFPLDFL
ncbi:unnamed protein product [Microthlaspi erraticum]|uniref:Uncharacterized protein n=1 Tax=Microthlaspi erraticum TaxID=1685480 RepID=A0A6D2JQQ2_9BRAS|nr:unnamed protein product [Microthlaspi erraticum]